MADKEKISDVSPMKAVVLLVVGLLITGAIIVGAKKVFPALS